MALTRRRKIVSLVVFGGITFGMVGVSFAAVPLYRIFCQVTGYGGTTQVADEAPAEIGERVIVVRFNADTAGGLKWRFKPEQREITLHVGETALAFYEAENNSLRTILGTSTFNVTPLKAGPYFNKIECFCFEEQMLTAGERAEFPVSFFVDPDISKDPNLDDIKTITLSYTFFDKGQEALDAYLSKMNLAGRETGQSIN